MSYIAYDQLGITAAVMCAALAFIVLVWNAVKAIHDWRNLAKKPTAETEYYCSVVNAMNGGSEKFYNQGGMPAHSSLVDSINQTFEGLTPAEREQVRSEIMGMMWKY